MADEAINNPSALITTFRANQNELGQRKIRERALTYALEKRRLTVGSSAIEIPIEAILTDASKIETYIKEGKQTDA